MSESSPDHPSRRYHLGTLLVRTLSKSWDDSIFSESAQAAFWSALSMPPLLLGLLGSLAYIAPLFSPDALSLIEQRLILMSKSFFSPVVVSQIIEPTIADIDKGARGEVVSLGFVISLWAGSSAVSAFVDSVVEAHGQTMLRHPVRQRFFALFLYINMLVIIIVTAPCATLGPHKVATYLPHPWVKILRLGYYPALFFILFVAITALYRLALPRPLPTHRLIGGAFLSTSVFMITTVGLRIYLAWITRTGYTYGALAAPIALLLCAFFAGFSVMIGAEFNASIQEQWPIENTHIHQFRTRMGQRIKDRKLS